MGKVGSDTWEVEQKFLLSDRDSLVEELTRLGFQQTKQEQHCDTYFRHPCRDFRATDEAFRLRRVNEEAVVTYKGRRLDAEVKTRPEIELPFVANDFEQWQTMFTHLGFEALPSVKKSREVFESERSEYEGFVATVDTVEELGLFAEIELVVNGQHLLQDAQHRIEILSKQLNLTEAQPKSYLAQLLAKLGVEK